MTDKDVSVKEPTKEKAPVKKAATEADEVRGEVTGIFDEQPDSPADVYSVVNATVQKYKKSTGKTGSATLREFTIWLSKQK